MSKEYFFDKDGDFSIDSIFLLAWEKKLLIIISTILLVFSSYIGSKFLDQTWTAKTVLMPTAANDATGGAAGSSLVSLVGVSLGGSAGVNGAQVAQEVIISRDFFKRIYEDDYYLVMLSGVKAYKDGKNIFDSEVYDSEEDTWIKKPSFESAFGKYRKGIRVDYKWELGGFVNISFTHSSPISAKEILSHVIVEVNNVQREKEILNSSANLKFLEQEITKVINTDVRRAAVGLMQNELKAIMFAKTRKYFVVEPLDSVYQPNNRTSPRTLIVIVLTTSIGLLIIMLAVVIRKLLEK